MKRGGLRPALIVDPAERAAAVALMAKFGKPDVLLVDKSTTLAKDMYSVSRFAELIQSIDYLARSSKQEREYEGDNSRVPEALRAWLTSGTSVFRAMVDEEVNELIAAVSKISKPQELSMFGKALAFAKSFGKSRADLAESIQSIVDDDTVTDKAPLIEKTLAQFGEHVEKTLSGDPDPPSEDEMSPALKKALGLPETATEAEALAAVAKRDLELAILKADMTAPERALHDALPEADRGAFRALDKAARAAEIAKRAPAPPAADPLVAKMQTELADLQKRNASLEHERDLAKFSKRATEIGLTEAQGELLMKAHAGDKDALTKLENAIKGLHEQIATGKLFTEFGSGQGASVDAYAEITAKAIELRKADPKLTIEKAKAKVIEDPANRDLVKRYNEERSGAHKRVAA